MGNPSKSSSWMYPTQQIPLFYGLCVEACQRLTNIEISDAKVPGCPRPHSLNDKMVLISVVLEEPLLGDPWDGSSLGFEIC